MASTTRPTAFSFESTATTVSDRRALPVSLAAPTQSPTLKDAETQLNSVIPAVSMRMRLSVELPRTRATFAALQPTTTSRMSS